MSLKEELAVDVNARVEKFSEAKKYGFVLTLAEVHTDRSDYEPVEVKNTNLLISKSKEDWALQAELYKRS